MCSTAYKLRFSLHNFPKHPFPTASRRGRRHAPASAERGKGYGKGVDSMVNCNKGKQGSRDTPAIARLPRRITRNRRRPSIAFRIIPVRGYYYRTCISPIPSDGTRVHPTWNIFSLVNQFHAVDAAVASTLAAKSPAAGVASHTTASFTSSAAVAPAQNATTPARSPSA